MLSNLPGSNLVHPHKFQNESICQFQIVECHLHHFPVMPTRNAWTSLPPHADRHSMPIMPVPVGKCTIKTSFCLVGNKVLSDARASTNMFVSFPQHSPQSTLFARCQLRMLIGCPLQQLRHMITPGCSPANDHSHRGMTQEKASSAPCG